MAVLSCRKPRPWEKTDLFEGRVIEMAKTRDMTVGSPIKLIFGFFLPLLFGLLFQQLYNAVDTVVVGRFLGVNALAGVGATGALNFLILGFCTGTCAGFAIPVAQKFGEHDFAGLKRYVCAYG